MCLHPSPSCIHTIGRVIIHSFIHSSISLHSFFYLPIHFSTDMSSIEEHRKSSKAEWFPLRKPKTTVEVVLLKPGPPSHCHRGQDSSGWGSLGIQDSPELKRGWQAQARNCGHFARWSKGIRYGHCYARPAGPHQEGSQAWCWVEAGHIIYSSVLHLSGTETAEPRISGNQKNGYLYGWPW